MADEILSSSIRLSELSTLNPAEYTILVVDDIESNIILLKMMLSREGYNVISCSDSTKVQDICLEQHPDLVLLDVMMPQKDGYKVALELKEEPKTADIPIIFLTAYFDKEHLLKGFQCGGSDYVAKPFEKEVLLARVNSQLKLLSATRLIRQKNQILEDTLYSRDKMYSVIAHDLRGPLGVVQVSLKALTDLLPADRIGADLSDLLVDCNKQVREVFGLLDNLLKWTKSQTGAINVAHQRFAARMLVDTTLDAYGVVAQMKGVRLQLDGQVETFDIVSDIDMCRTILRNLVQNAIKFTPSGKNIYMSVRQDGDSAVFKVQDEGCGMTEEELQKILDKHSHFTKYGTNREEGSGLGLKICQSFSELLGGVLNIESLPGVGSTFSVRIPLSNV